MLRAFAENLRLERLLKNASLGPVLSKAPLEDLCMKTLVIRPLVDEPSISCFLG